MSRPRRIDLDEMDRLLDQGMTLVAIARVFGVSPAAVSNTLKRRKDESEPGEWQPADEQPETPHVIAPRDWLKRPDPRIRRLLHTTLMAREYPLVAWQIPGPWLEYRP